MNGVQVSQAKSRRSERDGLVAIADLNEEADQDMWMRRVGTSGQITRLCSVTSKRMQL